MTPRRACLGCAAASPEAIDARLAALDRECDMDRAVELESSLLGFTGLALGVFARGATDSYFFLQRFSRSSCSTAFKVVSADPRFRQRGVRTSREIERERYAIKALGGDFDQVPSAGSADDGARARAALAAVDR
jgi:hypothetical protein